MTERLECDVLVIGGGLAGLSAGARASELGAVTFVVEKQSEIGGSAVVAGGYLWTVETYEQLVQMDAVGNPRLARRVIDDFDTVVDWMRSRNVGMNGPMPVLYGRGYHIDVLGHLSACVRTIEANGGSVVRGVVVEELLREEESERVTGARIRDDDMMFEVASRATVIATGGAQGDADLRERLIGPSARDALVRSNKGSTGDGLRLAMSVGAAVADNPGFYGHLVCSPTRLEDPADFRRLSMYHSPHGVLVGLDGERFVDESLGDHCAAQETLRLPESRALLVWDDAVHRDHVLNEYIKGSGSDDKLEVAIGHGARGAIHESLEGLSEAVKTWGFDGANLLTNLTRFNEAIDRGTAEVLSPPRKANQTPVACGPYRAVEVRAGVTFTYGGIRVDEEGRALSADEHPIDGLFVAGVDIGDVFRFGYAGGIALSLAFALRAAASAVGPDNA